MNENEPEEIQVPDGTAVFPLIPPELGVHPLTLCLLHSYVFMEGSEESVVNPAAAQEAMEYMAGYMQRLEGADLRRLREDMQTLVTFAKSEKWPKPMTQFLHDFLRENGIAS